METAFIGRLCRCKSSDYRRRRKKDAKDDAVANVSGSRPISSSVATLCILAVTTIPYLFPTMPPVKMALLIASSYMVYVFSKYGITHFYTAVQLPGRGLVPVSHDPLRFSRAIANALYFFAWAFSSENQRNATTTPRSLNQPSVELNIDSPHHIDSPQTLYTTYSLSPPSSRRRRASEDSASLKHDNIDQLDLDPLTMPASVYDSSPQNPPRGPSNDDIPSIKPPLSEAASSPTSYPVKARRSPFLSPRLSPKSPRDERQERPLFPENLDEHHATLLDLMGPFWILAVVPYHFVNFFLFIFQNLATMAQRVAKAAATCQKVAYGLFLSATLQTRLSRASVRYFTLCYNEWSEAAMSPSNIRLWPWEVILGLIACACVQSISRRRWLSEGPGDLSALNDFDLDAPVDVDAGNQPSTQDNLKFQGDALHVSSDGHLIFEATIDESSAAPSTTQSPVRPSGVSSREESSSEDPSPMKPGNRHLSEYKDTSTETTPQKSRNASFFTPHRDVADTSTASAFTSDSSPQPTSKWNIPEYNLPHTLQSRRLKTLDRLDVAAAVNAHISKASSNDVAATPLALRIKEELMPPTSDGFNTALPTPEEEENRITSPPLYPVPETNELHEFILFLKRHARLMVASYGLKSFEYIVAPPTPLFTPSGKNNCVAKSIFQHLAQVDSSSVLHASIQSMSLQSLGSHHSKTLDVQDEYVPQYYIIQDHVHNEVIVVFRGTQSLHDIVVDLTLNEATIELPDEKGNMRAFSVHSGMFDTARLLLTPTNPLFIRLKAALQDNPSYKLVLTGHSLGAAVAAMIALLIARKTSYTDPDASWVTSPDSGLPEGRTVQSLGFACPAVVDWHLARLSASGQEPLVLSLSLASDIIVRAGPAQFRELRNAIGRLVLLCRATKQTMPKNPLTLIKVIKTWWHWKALGGGSFPVNLIPDDVRKIENQAWIWRMHMDGMIASSAPVAPCEAHHVSRCTECPFAPRDLIPAGKTYHLEPPQPRIIANSTGAAYSSVCGKCGGVKKPQQTFLGSGSHWGFFRVQRPQLFFSYPLFDLKLLANHLPRTYMGAIESL